MAEIRTVRHACGHDCTYEFYSNQVDREVAAYEKQVCIRCHPMTPIDAPFIQLPTRERELHEEEEAGPADSQTVLDASAFRIMFREIVGRGLATFTAGLRIDGTRRRIRLEYSASNSLGVYYHDGYRDLPPMTLVAHARLREAIGDRWKAAIAVLGRAASGSRPFIVRV